MKTLASLALGITTWPLLEYVVHRELGHRYDRKKKRQSPFTVEHVKHHATTSYFASTPKKIAGAGALAALATPLLSLVVPPRVAATFVAGLMASYGAYEVLHRRCHTHPPTHAYGRWRRRHHFSHHFVDPNSNHGVTSPLFDRLIGTWRDVAQPIRVPERHAMPWLIDPATGDVRGDFTDDYVLLKKRRRTSPVATASPLG